MCHFVCRIYKYVQVNISTINLFLIANNDNIYTRKMQKIRLLFVTFKKKYRFSALLKKEEV